MIDFEQAIKDGMPPSQDVIDEDKKHAEAGLKQMKKESFIGIHLCLAVSVLLANTLDESLMFLPVIVFVWSVIMAGLSLPLYILKPNLVYSYIDSMWKYIPFGKSMQDLSKAIISTDVYFDINKLLDLKKDALFSSYFKELGAMKREITRAEVEAMESILEDRAAHERKESIYGVNPEPNNQSKYKHKSFIRGNDNE